MNWSDGPLYRMRRAAKLTQEKAAQALGITTRSYRRLECGTQPISPTIMRLLVVNGLNILPLDGTLYTTLETWNSKVRASKNIR